MCDECIHSEYSKALLFAHLIFITKYREELNVNGIWERIIHELYKACSELNVEVKEIKADRDHIHILIRYLLTLSIWKIIHHLKQVSTYRVWKAYERYLKTVYWHKKDAPV